jgi:exopolysaccharide biosynthesis polyprenyl glycosylphosphotransferase
MAYRLRGSHCRNAKQVVIVGVGPRGQRFFEAVKNSRDMRVLGFVDIFDGPHGRLPGRPVQFLGDLTQLEDILVATTIDEVVVALPMRSMYNEIRTTLEICARLGVSAKLLSDLFQLSRIDQRHETEHAHSMLHFCTFRARDGHLVLKRSLDVLGGAVGVLLLSPVMALIAVAIKLTSEGPVLFWQERYGLHKRVFRMCKFRSMRVDAEALQSSLEAQNEASGPVFKIRNDPRVTPLGRLLRRTSLDELPQLFNVLKGEMSLVGPRPLPKRDVSRFNEAYFVRRFSVRPGMTCLWQVTGRSNTDFTEWIDLDLQYIDTWSIGLDVRILFKTLPAVLKRTGAV